jgi:protein tyrosine/serine phosphatase
MKTLHIIILVCTMGCSYALGDANTNRPTTWATPIMVEGAPNLHKVSDALYRSAQPTEIGMQELRKMGIKTIINLRSFHSDRDEIKNVDLEYEHLYMKAWHPELKEAKRFLQVVTDPTRQPVLVHCQHGADRTGTMCAIYRIVVEGWTKEEAVREMREGGYGFHEVWKNLPAWIDELKVEDLQKTEESQ